MFREVVLGLGNNAAVSGVLKQYGMRLGASRFVAGQTLAEALAVSRDLNRRGIKVTLDHLGESVTEPAAAAAARDSYLEMLQALHGSGVEGNVSLKPTMLGLALDAQLARSNIGQVVERAAELNNFVRIDMEDSPYTNATLDIFRELWERHPRAVGVVLQAYLYRTRDDLAALSTPPKNFRIVKGAYREPPDRAFPAKPDVDENCFGLVEQSLRAGNYTAVATHDETLIERVVNWVERQGTPRTRFEFQMLYGIKLPLLEQLARNGYTTRVYVPFGQDWYAYFVRRLAERPANLLFFARALLTR